MSGAVWPSTGRRRYLVAIRDFIGTMCDSFAEDPPVDVFDSVKTGVGRSYREGACQIHILAHPHYPPDCIDWNIRRCTADLRPKL